MRLAAGRPELARPICDTTGAVGAEIVMAVELEHAGSLADIMLRRTMLGLSRDRGRQAAPAAVEIARQHCGWEASRAGLELEKYTQQLTQT